MSTTGRARPSTLVADDEETGTCHLGCVLDQLSIEGPLRLLDEAGSSLHA
jgi:hypothetical protein